MSDESKKLLEQEKAKLHTVESFIEEHYEPDSKGSVSSVKLYEHYKEWCKDNAIDPVGRNTFYDDVCQINTAFNRDKVFDGEKRVNGFKGLKIKSSEWIISTFKGGKKDERK